MECKNFTRFEEVIALSKVTFLVSLQIHFQYDMEAVKK